MNASETKTVVITGASSGIGRASVSYMIQSGWHVFATVRKSEDAHRLESEVGLGLTAVVMDVQGRSSIIAAGERVASQLQGRGLDGLVNVAGIGMMRPIEYASAEDMQEIFDINVFGQIAVTQAFLPLLRKARGRIVNISSVGAHISIPFGGLLNSSKSAFGALSDTLRLEMRPFGVHVSVIEPGAIKTPAVEKTLGNVDEVIAKFPSAGVIQYGDMLREFARRACQREMNGSSPDVVAEAVQHALTAARPRNRYRVGKHVHVLTALPKILPENLLDMLLLRIAGLPTKWASLVSGDHSVKEHAVSRG